MNGASRKFTPSEFTFHFKSDDIIKYTNKLDKLNISDPIMPPGILIMNLEAVGADLLPDLRYLDIYNYLINFPSSYSGESLKAYKSLQGYKWTQANFVTGIQIWSLPASPYACQLQPSTAPELARKS
ncbi:uncharacterized protein V6R79_023154 [Siganus canaliculatus]